MMKKPTPIRLTSLILAVASVVLLYAVQGPEGRRPASAIPRPKEGTPFLYFETANASSLPDLLKAAAAFRWEDDDRLRRLSALLNNSREAAGLITVEKNLFHLQLAVKMSRDFEGPPMDSDTDLAAPYLYGGDEAPLYCDAKGGITMFATRYDKLQEMGRILDDRSRTFKNAPELDRRSSNRLLISDGGYLSGIASIQGLPASKGTVYLSAAWHEGSRGGGIKWKIYGLSGVLPQGVLKRFKKASWCGEICFPEPLVAAIGVNIPELPDSSGLMNAEGLLSPFGASVEKIGKMLPGPCVLSLSGRSKFLVFSLPGLLMELPGRGQGGMDFIDQFWRTERGNLVPEVEKLEGFPSGGTSLIPFSILAAANPQTVRLGLIDRDALKSDNHHHIGYYAPSLSGLKEAFLWGYVDLEKFDTALKALLRTGRVAGKMGMDIKMSATSLLMITDLLEGVKSIVMLMTGPGEGMLEWTRIPRHDHTQAQDHESAGGN